MGVNGIIAFVLLAMALLGGLRASGETPITGAEISGGAAARIEKYRKGDATVLVVDAAGKPVAGAEVTIEQTSHAFLFGCNIFNWAEDDKNLWYKKPLNDEVQTNYRARFAELFNYATLPFYWHFYAPAQDQTRQTYLESVAKWCREKGIATKGHPLMWNYVDPTWLPNDKAAIGKLQVERVKDIVPRFKGLIDKWDVANELADFSSGGKGDKAPKITAMWAKDRMPVARDCFLAAREANPGALLLINDFKTDESYEKVLLGLADDHGKPLYDVIGLQSHQHSGVWSDQKLWDTCERFAKFGVPLHFTEMTILSGRRMPGAAKNAEGEETWVSAPHDEETQAKDVVREYTLLFSHPSVEAITWWNLIDGFAWMGAPAGLLRKDGTPKPAYTSLQKLIHETWCTRTSANSDAQGQVHVRGFYGNYHVTVRLSGKAAGEGTFVLSKSAGNEWKIVTR